MLDVSEQEEYFFRNPIKMPIASRVELHFVAFVFTFFLWNLNKVEQKQQQK